MTLQRSDCLNIEGRGPDINLLKACFQPFFQLHQKLPIAFTRNDINEHLHKLIAIHGSSVFPLALDYLQLVSHRAEPLTQFLHELAVKFLGNPRSVVKPPREINLVAA